MNLELISRKAEGSPKPNPLLLVHGAWHGAWCWDEFFMPYLAQHGYDCYALSLRGHGKSENNKSLRWTSVHDYAADVAQVVDSLPRPPVIIGHSMGGYLVQKYLETHTAPCAVLLASIPSAGILFPVMRYFAHHPLIILKTALTLSMYPIISTPELCKGMFFSPAMPDSEVHRYHILMQDESFRANFLDAVLLSLPRPARVKTPMVVIGAADDATFLPHEVVATARAYGTQATIISNIAHDVMLEANWQIVADTIIRQLGEHGL